MIVVDSPLQAVEDAGGGDEESGNEGDEAVDDSEAFTQGGDTSTNPPIQPRYNTRKIVRCHMCL